MLHDPSRRTAAREGRGPAPSGQPSTWLAKCWAKLVISFGISHGIPASQILIAAMGWRPGGSCCHLAVIEMSLARSSTSNERWIRFLLSKFMMSK
jgi:hypothetical protein